MATLSNDLKVACEIYKENLSRRPVWFSKLVETLDGVISRYEVSHAIDTLTDWGIIEGHYDSLGNGWSGYVYEISDSAQDTIKKLYETHYIDILR